MDVAWHLGIEEIVCVDGKMNVKGMHMLHAKLNISQGASQT